MTLPTPYAEGRDWVLYHGDCLDILPRLDAGGVDAVVTDPPYGINYVSRPTKWSRSSESRISKAWDNAAPDVSEILSLKVPTMIWGGNHFNLPPSRGWLVWTKPKGLPSYGTAELCWTNIEMPVRHRYEAWVRPKPRLHETQKSVSLMRWCLQYLTGKSILDPFAGSGTTGVACIRTGRKFIGIEIDERYCEVAARRMREAEDDQALFTHDQPEPEQMTLEGVQ